MNEAWRLAGSPVGVESLALEECPSANRYYRTMQGRVVLSSDGRTYKQLVAWVGAKARVEVIEGGDVALWVVWARRAKRGDLDNRIKPLLDALQGVVYRDDAQVARLVVVRVEAYESRVEPGMYVFWKRL